jgi:hypothetical protein
LRRASVGGSGRAGADDRCGLGRRGLKQSAEIREQGLNFLWIEHRRFNEHRRRLCRDQ